MYEASLDIILCRKRILVTEMPMYRLVCGCIVQMMQCQVFSRRGPFTFYTIDLRTNNPLCVNRNNSRLLSRLLKCLRSLYANRVDQDQTAPTEAVCSGSTLFASILNSSVTICSICSRRLQKSTFSFTWRFMA